MDNLGLGLGIFFGVWIFIIVLSLVVGIAYLVLMAMIAKKLDLPAWAGIIPFYNLYCFTKKVVNPNVANTAAIIMAVSPLLGLIPTVGLYLVNICFGYVIYLVWLSLGNKESTAEIVIAILIPIVTVIRIVTAKEKSFVGTVPSLFDKLSK